MEPPKRAPPSPWESNTEADEAASPDAAKVLGDLLLGKAGPPQSAIAQREIRASTGLVLGGVCLGLAGFGAIALAQGQAAPQNLRELGGVLGGLGLVLLLWGMLAGLPGHRTLRVLGLAGAAIGVVGLVAFVGVYPQNWGKPGVTDHTVSVIGTFVAGLVLLVAATFGSLVTDFVLRMQTKGRLRGELGREPTDEEIQRDIDLAMRKHKVTWGGLAEDNTKGIRVKAEALPGEWQIVNSGKKVRETVATGERLDAVDTAVNALTSFRGGRSRTSDMPEGGLGDATDALRALRTAQAERPVKRTWLDKLLGRWPKPPPGYGPPGANGPNGLPGGVPRKPFG